MAVSVKTGSALRRALEESAREAGLDLVGVAPARPLVRDARRALLRLQEGLMGGLPWYTPERVLRGADPRRLLPGARSVIAVAVSYRAPQPPSPPGLQGRVARYAWGRDYHYTLKKRLRRMVQALSRRLGRPIRFRTFVDDGPALDRAYARRAGVGWFGKNTLLLTRLGSWTVLGEVVTDLELEPDHPLRKSCGNCTLCLEACPTGALVAPYVLDSNRCISHLTIENRGPIPAHLRPLVGDWAFGCDLCQEVCPVNRRAPFTEDPDFLPRHPWVDLLEVLTMDEEAFRERFRGSPIRRARLEGLKRNACVALGNLGDPGAVPALARALRDPSPLVRRHSAWALGRLGGPLARRALQEALPQEGDPAVAEEIRRALEGLA